MRNPVVQVHNRLAGFRMGATGANVCRFFEVNAKARTGVVIRQGDGVYPECGPGAMRDLKRQRQLAVGCHGDGVLGDHQGLRARRVDRVTLGSEGRILVHPCQRGSTPPVCAPVAVVMERAQPRGRGRYGRPCRRRCAWSGCGCRTARRRRFSPRRSRCRPPGSDSRPARPRPVAVRGRRRVAGQEARRVENPRVGKVVGVGVFADSRRPELEGILGVVEFHVVPERLRHAAVGHDVVRGQDLRVRQVVLRDVRDQLHRGLHRAVACVRYVPDAAIRMYPGNPLRCNSLSSRSTGGRWRRPPGSRGTRARSSCRGIASRSCLAVPPGNGASSSAVGIRPANTSPARYSVRRADSIRTVSNSSSAVNAGPAASTSPASRSRNARMSPYASLPAATWMPPPWPTPWILSSTSAAGAVDRADEVAERRQVPRLVAVLRVGHEHQPRVPGHPALDVAVHDALRLHHRRRDQLLEQPPPRSAPAASPPWTGSPGGPSGSPAGSSPPPAGPPTRGAATCPRRRRAPRRGRRRSRVRAPRTDRAAPAATVNRTTVPGDRPSPSRPVTATAAGPSEELTTRSRLAWSAVARRVEHRHPVPAAPRRNRVVHRRQEAVRRAHVGEHLQVEFARQRQPPGAFARAPRRRTAPCRDCRSPGRGS